MEMNEFIQIFNEGLENNNDYNYILNDLNNNVFPFHEKNQYINCRRYYYWLKQNNSLKFKKLNGKLKKLVKNKIKPFIEGVGNI